VLLPFFISVRVEKPSAAHCVAKGPQQQQQQHRGRTLNTSSFQVSKDEAVLCSIMMQAG
jgi:hypothetical protein